jgi:hypothetical protein
MGSDPGERFLGLIYMDISIIFQRVVIKRKTRIGILSSGILCFGIKSSAYASNH